MSDLQQKSCGYCGEKLHTSYESLMCATCSQQVHLECLQTRPVSNVKGDTFYKLTCQSCGQNGEEVVRSKMSWLQVTMLALYNLQLTSAGKKGYFHWKDHIAKYIDRYWDALFAGSRKQSSSWHGTVAGTLSTGCPQFFSSGATELKESGWWALRENKPPTVKTLKPSKPKVTSCTMGVPEVADTHQGSRRRRTAGQTLMDAATKLKEKRAPSVEGKKSEDNTGIKGPKLSRLSLVGEDSSSSSLSSTVKLEPDERSAVLDNFEGVLCGIKSEKPDVQQSAATSGGQESYTSISDILKADSEGTSDSDIEIDPGCITPPRSTDQNPQTSNVPEMDVILSSLPTTAEACEPEPTVPESVKEEMESDQSEDEDDDDDDESDSAPSTSEYENEDESSESTAVKRTIREESFVEKKEPEEPSVRYVPMSLYEERKLLKHLTSLSDKLLLPPGVNRLKRKLVVRSIKRERGLPCFDLDAEFRKYTRPAGAVFGFPFEGTQQSDAHVLDRFQMPADAAASYQRTSVSFLNRLVGTEDDQLQSICSPYTARILKPFIRRDYESHPLKMKLLQEVIAYPHRHESDWVPPPLPPIDYCYVRPQHIPSVNALCREFFWPGIDLSECLQYPDFSCVVLYRRIVIGFAFMVPDVQYNEAYISFLFTHPEWRGAGIGSFILYHLIQTCMGKDVTLHVSASNPAMLLYQKFGFKPEEYILDFYDKYYPESSEDCKHAFLMRLKR